MGLGPASFCVIVTELLDHPAPGANARPIDAGWVVAGVIGANPGPGRGRVIIQDRPPGARGDHRRGHLGGPRHRHGLRLWPLPSGGGGHAAALFGWTILGFLRAGGTGERAGDPTRTGVEERGHRGAFS